MHTYKPHITVYTDGASRGNPGRGGYGVAMFYPVPFEKKIQCREISQGYLNTTNNRMELLAFATALEVLRRPCDINIYTDSNYIAQAINQGWLTNWAQNGWRKSNNKPVANRDLWERILAQLSVHDVRVQWVKGHADNPGNIVADRLATEAADNLDNLIIDEGYVA